MLNERTAILSRLFMILGLVLLIPFAIALQLLRINFVEGEELRKLWSEQAIDYISIPAQRGSIYDAGGSILATNSVAYNVAIDPQIEGITREQVLSVCRTLAGHTGKTARHYLQKIDGAPQKSRYVVLDRFIDYSAYDALESLNVHGLILEEQYRRRYSFGSLAAHILGFVNHNMDGMIGLENRYNNELKGADGLQQVRRDRMGRIFAYMGAPRKQPEQGSSLHTTIDAHIQAIVEEELKAGVERTKSNYGSAIVMDPRTGAIKAMANYPTFNPNNPASSDTENRRNFAISDMIEPGSTFKLATAIAAVEQGVVNFDEKFETPKNGQQLIHGQWMRDHEPLGTMDFTHVIAKSSNIATSRIAMRLTPKVFYQYVRNLGFGTPTNIDLPNEENGRLPKPYEWSRVTLPWMSIGYEVQVTPIQLIQAYAAFANNGTMMKPYVVDRIVDQQDNVIWKHKPVKVRTIAKKETIDKLYPVFRKVVSDSGTAEWVQIEGLPVAGKTGTAQKYMDGEYRYAHRASFVGFFPAGNPKYVALVLLDEPKTSIYGGYTAGPIFRQTATRIAGLDNDIQKEIQGSERKPDHWALVPNATGMTLAEARVLLEVQNLAYQTTGKGEWVAAQTPGPGNVYTPGRDIRLELSETPYPERNTTVPEGYAVIPDVGGMNMRKAALLINQQGFEAKLIGSGTIDTQFPRPGDLMKKGQIVTIRGKAKSLETIAGK